MAIVITNNEDIQVNNEKVSLQQLQEMMDDKSKKVVQLAPNRFKLLEKLLG